MEFIIEVRKFWLVWRAFKLVWRSFDFVDFVSVEINFRKINLTNIWISIKIHLRMKGGGVKKPLSWRGGKNRIDLLNCSRREAIIVNMCLFMQNVCLPVFDFSSDFYALDFLCFG